VGYKPFFNMLYRFPPNVRTTVLYSDTLSTHHGAILMSLVASEES